MRFGAQKVAKKHGLAGLDFAESARAPVLVLAATPRNRVLHETPERLDNLTPCGGDGSRREDRAGLGPVAEGDQAYVPFPQRGLSHHPS